MSEFNANTVFPANLSVMDVWGFVQKARKFSEVPDKIAFGLEATWVAGRAVNTLRQGGLPMFETDSDKTTDELCTELEVACKAVSGPAGSVDPATIIMLLQLISGLFDMDGDGKSSILELIKKLFS